MPTDPTHDVPSTADVLVVGGGPAGSAAAITLARAGRRVVVVDKAVFPRDKCCGDGLTTLALRELEGLGFDPTGIARWHEVGGAVLRAPGGKEVTVPLPDEGVYAAIAPRRELDTNLLDLARRTGAVVADGHGLTGLVVGPEWVDAEVARIGTVRARYVVAADGMWSPTRKMVGAGLPGYRGEWHAFRQYARNVTGRAAAELFVWFEPDLIPGYAWSFPLPDHRVNIGFGVLRDRTPRIQNMGGLWRDLLTRPHIAAALGPDVELEDRHLAWPIPARVDEVALTRGRVLFVGDAAAATDILTGEGIGQALLTGRLAAEAVSRYGALQPELVARSYEWEVSRDLFADHRMSKLLSRILGHRLGADSAIAIVDASGAWGRRNFARWMFEDEPRSIITTPRRWHRGFLARPGAWS